jgi:glutathione S-transferase
MSGAYRLFGAETSAYSTKMRSYLRYKGVEHEWRPRTRESEEELQSLAKFATLPVLVTASGFAVHDTTPMIEALEADRPEPSATPADPSLAFLASVLEEYADSWLAKTVFHYRWTRKKDQRLAAQRAVDDYFGAESPQDRKSLEDAAIVSMLGQIKLMGIEGELGAVLEKSFKRLVKALDDHLRRHLFIFGGRPTIADFAIAGQLIQLMKDPTPSKIIEKEGEFVVKWCEFMADPKAGGPFTPLEDLRETLAPLFSSELVAAFLPWAAENLESSLAGLETFDVVFGRETLTLSPLRSSARSFRELRRKFVTAQSIDGLKAFTDEVGATVYLLRPPPPERAAREPRSEAPAAPAADQAGGEGAGEAAREDGGPAAREAGEPASRRRRRRRRRGGQRSESPGAEEILELESDVEEDAEAEGEPGEPESRQEAEASADAGLEPGAPVSETTDEAEPSA